MKLMDQEGHEVVPGAMVHVATGPALGQAWRLEGIRHAPHGEHQVHCSRTAPKMGRVHKIFHPRVFGLEVVIDVRVAADRAHFMRALHVAAGQFILLTLGGVIAYFCAEWLHVMFGHGG